jgi:hypothetical protein
MSLTQRAVTFAAVLLLLATPCAEPLPWPRDCTAPQQATRFTVKTNANVLPAEIWPSLSLDAWSDDEGVSNRSRLLLLMSSRSSPMTKA